MNTVKRLSKAPCFQRTLLSGFTLKELNDHEPKHAALPCVYVLVFIYREKKSRYF